MKIYTGTGDAGTTGLQGGRRVSKGNARIAAYGAVDEANSAIGVAVSCIKYPDIADLLTRIQGELFVAGSDLSDPDIASGGSRITPEMVRELEGAIDRYDGNLPPLSNFILPGGDRCAVLIHTARAVVRRAESCVVALTSVEKVNDHCLVYLNRLSDLLFVLARLVNHRSNTPDVIWRP